MTASGSFVHQMATGELPREKYLRYLSQDAYFLFHFNRAYAQALRLAADVEEQRVFHELIGGVLDELKLHAAACEKWGVDVRRRRGARREPGVRGVSGVSAREIFARVGRRDDSVHATCTRTSVGTLSRERMRV